jgi:hypothetical protein
VEGPLDLGLVDELVGTKDHDDHPGASAP